MSMTIVRLVKYCLYYKVQEILENNGFSEGDYIVVDDYPNEQQLDDAQIWPLVSVAIEATFGRNVEMGSKQWPACQISIDIFARSDSQRDDLSYLIWSELNESYYTLYNFNDSFPSAVGNYSGIPSLGEWYIDNLSTMNLVPPKDTVNEGEKHHCLIDGIVQLPNI